MVFQDEGWRSPSWPGSSSEERGERQCAKMERLTEGEKWGPRRGWDLIQAPACWIMNQVLWVPAPQAVCLDLRLVFTEWGSGIKSKILKFFHGASSGILGSGKERNSASMESLFSHVLFRCSQEGWWRGKRSCWTYLQVADKLRPFQGLNSYKHFSTGLNSSKAEHLQNAVLPPVSTWVVSLY